MTAQAQLFGGVPSAMLFVPSVEGRSPSAAEYTSPEDAALGATVLAAALQRLAYSSGLALALD